MPLPVSRLLRSDSAEPAQHDGIAQNSNAVTGSVARGQRIVAEKISMAAT